MLTLNACVRQGCEALVFRDVTGNYSEDNAGGYGPENGVESPSDFDSYTLRVWAPDLDPQSDEPSATIDLLTDLPAPDADGFYEWTLTPAMLGVSTIVDGVWYFEAQGNTTTEQYDVAFDAPIYANLQATIKEKMLKWKPGCTTCNKGGVPADKLFMALTILCKGAVCDTEKTKEVIKWLQAASKSCC